ncbi:MAG: hypothetical protein methR_P2745 [Methyloprofundus sp.]|nr:MAG: hypothetical protein methR_P2745 [Methyloprofundus sp.]
MSNLRKKNDKNKTVRNVAVINSATQLSVLKMNRLVLTVIVSLMTAVIVMGMFLMPDSKITNKLAQVQPPVELYDVQMNPVLSAEVDALKSQLVGLVSGSIEGKLKVLEDSLRTGTIADTGLDTIYALREDLVVLKTYSETGAGRMIAQKYLPAPVVKLDAAALATEVSQLRSMINFLITSCGLMFAAIAGVWVRKQYALTSDMSTEQQKIL